MGKKMTHKTHHNAVGKDYNTYISNDSAFKAQKRYRTIEGWKKADRKQSADNTIGIFKIVFLVLIAFSIIALVRNSETLSFMGFLDILSNAPQIDLSWLDWTALNLGDWGVFNFLRDFFNSIIGFFNMLAFLGTMVVQLLMYLLYFLRIIFL